MLVAEVQLEYTASTARMVMRAYTALSACMMPAVLQEHYETRFLPEVKSLFENHYHTLGSASHHISITSSWMRPSLRAWASLAA